MSNSINWITLCDVRDLVKNSGVCALINNRQIALFSIERDNNTSMFAIDNWDPIAHANVMYRGIVGSVENDVVVASPIYKQRYRLASGECIDNPELTIRTYAVRQQGDSIQVDAGSL